MKSIEAMADAIIQREGGFSDNPGDPGGATRFGVTLATLRRLGLDLTGDGKVDRRDLRKLDRKTARDIFIRDYYLRPRIDLLPEELRENVFDMYVNSGAQAVRLLQRLLGDMGHRVKVDGLIGPQTARAARLAAEEARGVIGDAYGIARRNYYYALADRRPRLRRFARRRDGGKGGWIRRAESFISPKYRLSDAEHARRVAAWA